MTVVSKYLDEAIVRYEKMGFSKQALSKGIVSIAIGAYVAHISYPYLTKLIKAANLAPVLSETAGTSDDDTSDSDFDSESDDYESAIESNNINSNNRMNDKNSNDTSFPDGTTKLGDDDRLDNDETARGVETENGDRLAVPPNTKRKRKHSKVIKQQIKQAEKFLAQATQERKKSKQVGNLSFSQLEESRIGLNLEFLFKLKRLLHIMIPRIWSRETGILGVHTACLISRTFLSIYVAAIEGSIVKFIVRRDLRQFIIGLMKWFSIAIPATFINSMIRYLENKLALSFRTRLVNHSYKLYFKNQTYYRVANLDGRIENADHRLTEDISVFTSSIAHLYSHLTKPCFDLMLIGLALMRSSRKMKANIVTGPALAFVVISATALILRQLSPKFGQLVAEEATRYGYLRHVHARVITNAEEIAFYGGQRVELMQLREAFRRLTNQMNIIYTQRLWFVMLEQFFMKYVWSGTGMIMISLPVLMGNQQQQSPESAVQMPDDGISERTQYLTTARNLLISGADAIERLMSSYKEIVALAGYTYRVAGMLEVFDDTAHGRYHKIMMAEGRNNAGILEFRNGQPVTKGRIIVNTDPNDRSISLNNVPVVTPNCDIVVPSLTLRIEPGMHLLITGPNGCGKSSLFRIVNGLWPIYGGELHIPKPIIGKPSMFYIPQRPYLTIGNLRDQIIYPDTVDDMLSKNYSEDMLHDIMKTVSLEHIVARDSFDVVRDWKDILSGGEKQRMAIARLFYHKPQYALLDECTSAVSIDVESSIYEAAKTAGITLLTITHRPTLWKFHTHILQFDGQGGWDFNSLSENDTQQKVPLIKKQ